jgi:mono/diheme cytochrome c family protein
MSLATIIGIQIALLGLVSFALTPRLRQRWPGVAALSAILPSLLVIGGMALALTGAFGGSTPLSSESNPVAATVTSVDAGNRLYQANCAACHGVSGEGGGPLANTTPIQPPSLKAHLSQHTDGDLFYWITNGLPGGMPAWASTLSPTDRWNVINYLRAINAPGSSIGPATVGPSTPASVAPSADGSAVAILALPAAWVGFAGGLVARLARSRMRERREGRRHPLDVGGSCDASPGRRLRRWTRRSRSGR